MDDFALGLVFICLVVAVVFAAGLMEIQPPVDPCEHSIVPECSPLERMKPHATLPNFEGNPACQVPNMLCYFKPEDAGKGNKPFILRHLTG